MTGPYPKWILSGASGKKIPDSLLKPPKVCQFNSDLPYYRMLPGIHEFRKYAADIAWETEVWIADNPDHMIHFNGPKFLGPYKPKGN